MFCSQCGANLEGTPRFCSNCGARVTIPTPVFTPAPADEPAHAIEPVVEAAETPSAIESDEPTSEVISTLGDSTIVMPDLTEEVLAEALGETPIPDAVETPEAAPAGNANAPYGFAPNGLPLGPDGKPVMPTSTSVVNQAVPPKAAGTAAPPPNMDGAVPPTMDGAVPPTAPSGEALPITEDSSAAVQKKKKGKTLPIILAILVIVIVIAVIVPTTISRSKAKKYDQACTLMEEGNYEDALTLFREMGDYEDAASMAQEAETAINYQEACTLMDAGNYEDACTMFEALGSYKDSFDRSVECSSLFFYESALRSIEDDKYEDAITSLNLVDTLYVPEAEQLLSDCNDELDYREGKEFLDAGNKCDAYECFQTLSGYKDSDELAKSCTTAYPSTGETYHNSDFKSNACDLTIQAPSDGTNSFIKIYSGDTLVSSIFLADGKSAKISLPAGTYVIKSAYSHGPWFGEDDLFGNQGIYEVLTFGGDATSVKFENNYEYTLSLRSGNNGGGDDVGHKSESKDNF